MHAVPVAASAAALSLGAFERENVQREFNMRCENAAPARTIALPCSMNETRPRVVVACNNNPTMHLDAERVECANFDFDAHPDAFAQCLEHMSEHVRCVEFFSAVYVSGAGLGLILIISLFTRSTR